jgi:hypothetical protein
MITIEIIQADFIEQEEISFWRCWLRLTNDIPAVARWMLPVTAPGSLVIADLQAHFDRRSAALWRLAEEKQYAVGSGESGAIAAKGGARRWYTDNLGARQLFTLDGPDLEAAIAALVAASFPELTTGQRDQ